MRTLMLLLSLFPALVRALNAPVVGISATMVNDDGQVLGDSVYVHLGWSPVPMASRYQVFYRSALSDALESCGFTTATSFELAVPTGWGWQGSPDVLGFINVIADGPDEFVTIPPGNFMMGQDGYNTPVHYVR
jgi:hypothetical protein